MISKCIQKLCEERNITINELAKRSNIPPTTVYSIVNGKSKNTGINVILCICKAMDISIADFLKKGLET